ncbi:N-acetylmuramoyl-L-alanine amidase [Plantactinospora sp. WMMB334]|uniref:peptidoglycan recognition protein family protein n=1 Tax=Plantactinospora sp. WMMB334 TaxID=3404119 RepID=UPI003B95A4CA
MALTWLADELRKAGLTVVEHSGWKTHDRPGSWSPTYGVVHATAAPRSQADSVQVRVVRDGRSDLPGPIANAVVDRQGRWHVVSAGRCNSTLTGTAGPYKGRGNSQALSTEACNDNRSEPWPAAQYRSYVRGWAAWCRRLGWPASRLVGHKEHTPGRKTDPTFNMDQFRRNVAGVLAGEDDDMEQSDKLRATTGYAGRDIGDVLGDVSNLRDLLVDPSKAYGKPGPNSPIMRLLGVPDRLAELEQRLAELAATPPGSIVITDEQLERVLRRIARSVPE